ncbi:hypothetical protein EST38_g2752 [Candolleomyces aberdarensis]|uniref:Nephrocystin 3-like N-terminal domain-containing protein n=1 Tax=Candolleomyces aberdarensis TaxID=2316362 RepID=A0A4Q2DRQ2_9AGAR|nr:hypothetical protein EST38_g2752 [Candolleomyces aberdarensis]
MTSFFTDARDVSVNELKVINVSPPIGDPLNGPIPDLVSQIAPGALHDSAERCDAPKCHPETRVAVQGEIYSWIIHGDSDPAQNMVKIKWVTGPAGTGKSAIMGSVADTCKKDGVPAVTFFFSASASPDRRRKTAFIPTLAYQLAEHLPALKGPVAQAIRDKPLLFTKNLRVQMEALILTPLRQVTLKQPGVVLVDGVDECEVEQYVGSHISPRAGGSIERTKDEDQLEILEVLREASLDPAFPFRIVIASRPERVFREFFKNESYKSSFAPNLILDEKYNPNADIVLFLRAKFSEIRRRFNLSTSWPSPEILATLLDQASGQFIYAATVIRYITTARHGSPQTLLDCVLNVKPTSAGTSPFSHLDAFYTHILQSAANSTLAVKWLWILKGEIPGWADIFTNLHSPPAAFLVNLLLQTDNGNAEYVLGDLHSLIDVPPSDDLETPYRPYHKSLYDFLGSEDRCGPIYVGDMQCAEFLWGRFYDIYEGLPACRPLDQQKFLHFFFNLFMPDIRRFTSRLNFAPSSVDWWVSGCVLHSEDGIRWIFYDAHYQCHWYRCSPACKLWRNSILRHCKKAGWKVPSQTWLLRNRFDRFLDIDNVLQRKAATDNCEFDLQ